MRSRTLSAIALLALTPLGCNPEAPLFFSRPTGGGPSTITVTEAGTLFGRGFHRGNCNVFAGQLQPRFTASAAGPANVTLRFLPLPGQELSLTLEPAAGATVQGPGPTVDGRFLVRGGVEYVVRICVPIGPGLDPGPFAATVEITHP